jgi:NAD(P)-dependent dehydrogenase (short-subunit alcohol dehydrogenase family)
MEDTRRTAIVTGAGSGIGRATSLRLAQRGYAVACLDLRGHAAGETAGSIRDDGGEAWAVPVDVGVESEVEAAVRSALGDERGDRRLDVLVNAAGIVFYRRLADTTADDVRRLLDVNLLGTFAMCRAAAPALAAARGAIVNIASGAALNGRAYLSAYSASKGGVLALSSALAVELAPDVRVNVVCPGAVDTPMADTVTLPADADAERLARHPSLIGRKVTADEVAAAVVHLASPEAGSTTGAVLRVDGGAAA